MRKDSFQDTYYWNYALISALKVTISWFLVGLIAYTFEEIILFTYQVQQSPRLVLLLYILPPVFVGFPVTFFEHLYFNRLTRRLSFRQFFLVKGAFYLLAVALVYWSIWYFWYQPAFESGKTEFSLNHFLLRFAYVWAVATFFIFIFKNLSDHFDRRSFYIWLTGKYFQPSEEERIFLFLDLNDSTPIMERLGHVRYFHFMNDFYRLTAHLITRYRGEIYQYVGDEVVMSWSAGRSSAATDAVNLFFDIRHCIEQNRGYFLRKYGIVPTFKGSLHVGLVTRGEIGVVKKDFVFTGDVLHTTSRMYRLCKKHKAPLVVSHELLTRLDKREDLLIEAMGAFLLRGKSEEIEVYAISEREYVEA